MENLDLENLDNEELTELLQILQGMDDTLKEQIDKEGVKND